jgi:hypothetical protein
VLGLVEPVAVPLVLSAAAQAAEEASLLSDADPVDDLKERR